MPSNPEQMIVTGETLYMLTAFINSLDLNGIEHFSDDSSPIFEINITDKNRPNSTFKVYSTAMNINREAFELGVDRMDDLISIIVDKFYYIQSHG